MFLRRLVLENIRSIESLDMDFTAPCEPGKTRQWTCILGENGIGKSTILRSAGMLLAGSEALPKLLGDPKRWLRIGARLGRISAQIVTQDGQSRNISLEFGSRDTLTSVLKRNEENLKPLDAALVHSSRNYFTAGYGVSRRFPSPDSEKFQGDSSMLPRAQSVATLFRGDSSLRSIESWAMDLHYRKGSTGMRMIREALDALLPEVKFYKIDKERRQLLFSTADGRIPLGQLSDGYQSVISWYGDLLFRITEVFRNYKKPQDARGLLLLDEVDLHLHPKWQRRVIDHLRETLPNLQFIATTHSPLTAQQCGEAELYVVKREGRQPVTLHHYEAAPNLLRVDQLLVSPVFGLDSGMSVAVEELRAKKSSDLTADEKEVLRSVPRPRVDAESEKEKIELLKEVRQELLKSGGRPRAAKKAGTAAKKAAKKAARAAGPAAYQAPSVRGADRPMIKAALKAK